MNTGMSWYTEGDYSRVREMMADGAGLPATYAHWLQAAMQGEQKLQRAGHVVVRAGICPDEFVAWCTSRNMQPDGKARTAFAAEFARHAAPAASAK